MSDKSMWARFAEAKAEMAAPVRNTDAYKYQYADLAQVRGIVMPALHNHGLDVTQAINYHQTATDIASAWRYCLVTKVVDQETGNELLSDVRHLTDGTDKQRGSSETYQRRYALLTVCGLAPEDDDGKAASEQPKGDPLTNQKARLWAAVTAYAEKMGEDPKKVAEGVRKRPDYAETADWYEMVAQEFEGEL